MAIITRKRRRMMLESAPPPSQSPSLSPPPTVLLPEELMIEILSRVTECNPLQLRCVCKWWKSLVSDPQFVKSHLHRSITEINDLASKALDDMNAFESQLNYAPAAAAAPVPEAAAVVVEEAQQQRSLMNELDNMLVVVQSLKESLETIKVDVQEISDKMKCLQSFLQIYLKTASSSSSSSS